MKVVEAIIGCILFYCLWNFAITPAYNWLMAKPEVTVNEIESLSSSVVDSSKTSLGKISKIAVSGQDIEVISESSKDRYKSVWTIRATGANKQKTDLVTDVYYVGSNFAPIEGISCQGGSYQISFFDSQKNDNITVKSITGHRISVFIVIDIEGYGTIEGSCK